MILLFCHLHLDMMYLCNPPLGAYSSRYWAFKMCFIYFRYPKLLCRVRDNGLALSLLVFWAIHLGHSHGICTWINPVHNLHTNQDVGDCVVDLWLSIQYIIGPIRFMIWWVAYIGALLLPTVSHISTSLPDMFKPVVRSCYNFFNKSY